MGAKICFTNHIHIAERSYDSGLIKHIGYKDVTPDMMDVIEEDSRIKMIQIDRELPEGAYEVIDHILEKRPDLYLRIFSIGTTCEKFDLSVLGQMPHLSKVWLDAYLRHHREAINPECLCELPNLKCLHMNLFDYRDYRFINHLPHNLEELLLYADTMGTSIQFDCEWLLQYKNLQRLELGKKAKKNLESISRLTELQYLSLRGIKVKNFNFLKELSLDTFRLLWCGNSDLSELGEIQSLRELELWRIMKLDNLDFISSLIHLEVLKLQDLKHIKTMPDLSNLKELKRIYLDNVPIDRDTMDESVRKLLYPQ